MQQGLAPGTLPTRMSARNPKRSQANFALWLAHGWEAEKEGGDAADLWAVRAWWCRLEEYAETLMM